MEMSKCSESGFRRTCIFWASRIRICVSWWEVRIRGSASGFIPKCHGSPTLLNDEKSGMKCVIRKLYLDGVGEQLTGRCHLLREVILVIVVRLPVVVTHLLLKKKIILHKKFTGSYSLMIDQSSDHCCGSGMFIPDPRSKNSNKREGWKKFSCQTFFCSHKFHKIENYFIFKMMKNKMRANFQRIEEFFT